MLEREIKLEVPEGVLVPGVGELWGRSEQVEVQPVRNLDAEYFDTSDLRLARWGCSLRRRSDEGWMVKLPVEDGGPALVRDEIRFDDDGSAPPEAARALVAGFTRGAPLVTVARLRTRRQPAVISDDLGRIAEATDDAVTVDSPGGEPGRMRIIEVEMADGRDLAVIAHLLATVERLGATVTHRSKIEQALGVDPTDGEVPLRVLGPSPTTDEVVGLAVALSVRRLILGLPGVRLGNDPEAVHQTRVAVRRLRSDLRTFGPVLELEWTRSLRRELGWLGGALGEVRDVDVIIETVADLAARQNAVPAEDAASLLGHFSAERASCRNVLVAALDSDRAARLLDALVVAGTAPRVTVGAGGPAAEVLPLLVRAPWRQLRTEVKALGPMPEAAALHRVRILAKRCRYAADAVAPAVHGDRPAEFAAAMTAIQDCLGQVHDATVIGSRLEMAATASPSLAYAAEVFTGLLTAGAAEAGAAFETRWHEASRKRLRNWW